MKTQRVFSVVSMGLVAVAMLVAVSCQETTTEKVRGATYCEAARSQAVCQATRSTYGGACIWSGYSCRSNSSMGYDNNWNNSGIGGMGSQFPSWNTTGFGSVPTQCYGMPQMSCSYPCQWDGMQCTSQVGMSNNCQGQSYQTCSMMPGCVMISGICQSNMGGTAFTNGGVSPMTTAGFGALLGAVSGAFTGQGGLSGMLSGAVNGGLVGLQAGVPNYGMNGMYTGNQFMQPGYGGLMGSYQNGGLYSPTYNNMMGTQNPYMGFGTGTNPYGSTGWGGTTTMNNCPVNSSMTTSVYSAQCAQYYQATTCNNSMCCWNGSRCVGR